MAEQKIKKRDDDLTLQLAKTTDILAATASLSSERLVRIGFAAESQDLVSNAADKLERKRLDLIVANDISRTDSGFGTDDNAVVLLDPDGRPARATAPAEARGGRPDPGRGARDQAIPRRLTSAAPSRDEALAHRRGHPAVERSLAVRTISNLGGQLPGSMLVLGEAGGGGGALRAMLGGVLVADGLAADVAVPLDGHLADDVRAADDADQLLAGHDEHPPDPTLDQEEADILDGWPPRSR